MPDIDRSRLVPYVALGLLVCVLGARHVVERAGAGGDGASSAGAPAGGARSFAEDPDAGAGHRPAGGAGREGAATGVSVARAGAGSVTVHVAGHVRRPGVYRLPAGSRGADALARAGGARPRAELSAVNLAARLEDGRQLLVPRAAAGAAAAAVPAAAGAPSGAPRAPINLNTATLEQLDTLDGVGPGIAQRILDHRARIGGFSRVEQLDDVPGIGPERLAALTPLVTV